MDDIVARMALFVATIAHADDAELYMHLISLISPQEFTRKPLSRHEFC